MKQCNNVTANTVNTVLKAKPTNFANQPEILFQGHQLLKIL